MEKRQRKIAEAVTFLLTGAVKKSAEGVGEGGGGFYRKLGTQQEEPGRDGGGRNRTRKIGQQRMHD